MIVRFDKISGVIINIVNNEHFVQSDTNTHDIDVIFDNNFDNTNYNAYIQFLRQGETKSSPKLVMTPKVITYNNEIYKGYSFKVQTDWYTAIAGTLKATIEVKEYNEDGLQSNKAYGIINIPIEEAVDDNPQVVSTITDEEYLALINLVNSKLNIVDEKVHLIEDTNIASYSQFVDACIAHSTTYKTTRIYLGHVSSQPAIGLVDQNDDVTIISSTGDITKINRDGIETNITLNQVKVDSLKVESSFESSGNFKAGQAQFTGLVSFDDRIYSNAITTEYLTAMNTSSFYSTTSFNGTALLQNMVVLGNDGIFDATHGNIKIKDVPLLNISDSSWSNYPSSIKTMLDYVAANSTSDREYAADLVNTLKQQIQNGTITSYGAQYDNAGNQFITYYLKYIDIVDDLSSLETLKPLSAYQGKILKDKIDAIQAIISSDDVNLDTIQEIVNYIKDNKADIDEFLATKVNISDIIDNLNSTLTNKPLSANQGRVLKELIDAIVNGTTTVANKGYVDSKIEEVNNKLSNVGNVSDLQTTDKSSLVNAINECNNKLENVGNISELQTTDKTNLVNAINECVSEIGDVNQLKNDLVNYTGNARITGWRENSFIATNGATVNIDTPVASANWHCVVLECSENDVFIVSGHGGGTPRMWCFADENKNVLVTSGHSVTYTNFEIIAPKNAKYLILNDDTNQISYVGKFLTDRVSAIEDFDRSLLKPSKNLVDTSKMFNGYIAWYESLVANDSYRTTDYIHVKSGETITFSPKIRKLAVYNSAKTGIEFKDEVLYNYSYTMQSDGYVRASYFTSDVWIQAEIGESVTKFEPFGYKFGEDIFYNSFGGNILYMKKYVACGDSFTEGEFTGGDGNHIFADGLYKGKNKVYPYWIGRRNYMIVENEAKVGSTMTYIDGRQNEFSTPNGRYTKIPADADYITLKFGINDCHANVPLGNVDDNVNTTFYGAWNIVLRYLITNHPYAKIGMIVGNGLNVTEDFHGETYAEAERVIAKRWGIPILDEDGDNNLPYLLRVNRDGVIDEAKNLRNASFVVNPMTNAHPNQYAHEYESTIVEDFLRRL